MFDEIQYVCVYQCVKLQLECVYQHATACIIGVISTHTLLLVKTTWLKYTYRERQREEKDGENMSGAYPQMYEIRSTASGVRVWVLQARSCFWAYVGLPVWNRVPVSHPPSHLLSLPLSPSLSLYFSISLTLCICSPLCGHHHNACGHTSLGKLFSGDDPQPRTNTHA